jgi:hypothetical protein
MVPIAGKSISEWRCRSDSRISLAAWVLFSNAMLCQVFGYRFIDQLSVFPGRATRMHRPALAAFEAL